MQTEQLEATSAGIARAAKLLREGALVAFPTETVYGLGADATDDRAVAGIFEAKRRPRFNPLIVHVADVDHARQLAVFGDSALRLAGAFWPGPLTLVLPRRSDCRLSHLISPDLPSVALRCPASVIAQALLAEVGRPVAAPSANPSGRISPTSAAHVLEGLDGQINAVLDGGPCEVGLESTIVGLTDDTPRLLRAGGLPSEAIEAALGPSLAEPNAGITAPGQLSSHYAPDAPLRLNADTAREGEFLIGFGGMTCDFSLSVSGDLREAAANLFAALHVANQSGQPIAVLPIPEKGLGRAINDRLRRAAAPRRTP